MKKGQTKAVGKKGDVRSRRQVKDLPPKSLGAGKASSVKGGFKMLTVDREAQNKAKNLASGV